MGTQAAMMSIYMLRSPALSAMVERDLINNIRSSQEAAAAAAEKRIIEEAHARAAGEPT